jgi:ribose-phosphate pyrophosphokinase
LRSSTSAATRWCRTRSASTRSSDRSRGASAIDTGRTIVKAAEALKNAGAIGVVVAATHAVFSDPAVELLQSEAIDSVVVTDTLPVDEAKRFEKLTVLSIAPLIARAIHEVFDDGSVTSMFDGAA